MGHKIDPLEGQVVVLLTSSGVCWRRKGIGPDKDYSQRPEPSINQESQLAGFPQVHTYTYTHTHTYASVLVHTQTDDRRSTQTQELTNTQGEKTKAKHSKGLPLSYGKMDNVCTQLAAATSIADIMG